MIATTSKLLTTGVDAQTCRLIVLDQPIESIEVLRVQPLSRLGSPVELIKRFGGRERYVAAVRDLERALYHAA